MEQDRQLLCVVIGAELSVIPLCLLGNSWLAMVAHGVAVKALWSIDEFERRLDLEQILTQVEPSNQSGFLQGGALA